MNFAVYGSPNFPDPLESRAFDCRATTFPTWESTIQAIGGAFGVGLVGWQSFTSRNVRDPGIQLQAVKRSETNSAPSSGQPYATSGTGWDGPRATLPGHQPLSFRPSYLTGVTPARDSGGGVSGQSDSTVGAVPVRP